MTNFEICRARAHRALHEALRDWRANHDRLSRCIVLLAISNLRPWL